MTNIPNEKRYGAETWQTSKGTFKKTHVGNLELMFVQNIPCTSRHCRRRQKVNVLMILDIDILAEFGVILDCQGKKIKKITILRLL